MCSSISFSLRCSHSSATHRYPEYTRIHTYIMTYGKNSDIAFEVFMKREQKKNGCQQKSNRKETTQNER